MWGSTWCCKFIIGRSIINCFSINFFKYNSIDKYKAKRAKPGVSRKKIPAEKTSAQLGNSKSMPAIGFYGRKVANDLRTHEGDKCFPIGKLNFL